MVCSSFVFSGLVQATHHPARAQTPSSLFLTTAEFLPRGMLNRKVLTRRVLFEVDTDARLGVELKDY